jgi:hypothetical protein
MFVSRLKERLIMARPWLISAAVAGLLAAVAVVPSRALAGSQVPFQATIAETYTATICGPAQLCINAIGSGQATQLGNTAESASVVSDLASTSAPGCHTETRTTTLTAANGDQITLQATGENCSTGPTTVTATDAYMVTGGTGRYFGATGSGTNTVAADRASGTAVVTFSGTLSTPGSLQ